MKYFLSFIIILGIIYNIYKKKENLVSTSITKIAKIGVFASLLLTLFVCYKYDNTFTGYIIAVAAVVFFASSYLAEGIDKKGFNIKVGGNLLLSSIKFEKVKSVDIVTKTDYLELNIYTFSGNYKQIYKIDNFEKIVKLINNKGFSLSYK